MMRSNETDLLVQSLQAAYSTTNDDFFLHSIHAFFNETESNSASNDTKINSKCFSEKPVKLNVERTRDGRNFVIRFVKAEKNERFCVLSEFSFQRKESVKDRYSMNPKFPKDLPDPETIKAIPTSETSLIPIEIRAFPILEASTFRVWIKTTKRIDPDDIKKRQAFLVNLSGYNFFNDQNDERINDFFTWFHQYFFDVNDWILIEIEEIGKSRDRHLYLGRIWSKSGELLMSTSQERTKFKPKL